MSFNYIGYTEKGSRNAVNEDHVIVNGKMLDDNVVEYNKNDAIIAVISDGVGGNDAGEVASEIVADGFKSVDPSNLSVKKISRLLNSINEKLIQKQGLNIGNANMAATVAGVAIVGKSFISFNIGDTRIYSFHDNILDIISKDHVLSENGIHTKLTRYIGGNGMGCRPYIRHGAFETPAITILLCSDGIYRYLSEKNITDVLGTDIDICQKKQMLLEMALSSGTCDDKSIVIIENAA